MTITETTRLYKLVQNASSEDFALTVDKETGEVKDTSGSPVVSSDIMIAITELPHMAAKIIEWRRKVGK